MLIVRENLIELNSRFKRLIDKTREVGILNNLIKGGFEGGRGLGVVKGVVIPDFPNIPLVKGKKDFPSDVVVKLGVL